MINYADSVSLDYIKTLKQKGKPNHQQTGFKPHAALKIRRGKKKKKKKQHKNEHTKNLTQCKAYTNNWTNLRRGEANRKNPIFQVELGFDPKEAN